MTDNMQHLGSKVTRTIPVIFSCFLLFNSFLNTTLTVNVLVLGFFSRSGCKATVAHLLKIAVCGATWSELC